MLAPTESRFARQPLKLRGRTAPTDDLRHRCLERVREGRGKLLNRLRELSDETGSCTEGFRGFAREILKDEMMSSGTDGPVNSCFENQEEEEALMLLLEEELLRDFEQDSIAAAQREAEYIDEFESEAALATYEQYMLGGVPCPLCGFGRLRVQPGGHEGAGELRCTSCEAMRASVMDEDISLEQVSEQLGCAEEQHRFGGCTQRACFEVKYDFGAPLLFLTCKQCGWCEVAL
eukprot:gnl/TRDRNA2_/TRDRNA2_187781_c0_seq1.p1 gnl/TRDRNA2_/TRDRNA2_187781_c0~~gnl/TRDRNA2_/TRDRNA2_187781_c0_seq1.p1  ORF type:complete len:233 (+),score=50.96 gnl/TRDRNA2_/TRDRNA2_187781_c0_seq1:66-764(+)